MRDTCAVGVKHDVASVGRDRRALVDAGVTRQLLRAAAIRARDPDVVRAARVRVIDDSAVRRPIQAHVGFSRAGRDRAGAARVAHRSDPDARLRL